MIDLSIVIPCYNEEDNISFLFKNLKKLISKHKKRIEIIIVENGSTDKTRSKIQKDILFKSKKIKLVLIDKNKGYGHGIMTGVKKSKGNYVSWCHADMQTKPQDVFNAFYKNKLNLKKFRSVVKGKRINRNYFDQIFTIGMSILASLTFGRKLTDINAMPKLFPKSFIRYMKNPPNDFSLDVYFLVIAAIKKYKIIEHEVNWNDRKYGEAKGGGSIKAKFNLTIQTLKRIHQLKNSNIK
tara:strand:- start:467 stop:1183 length:717 start_codon:yes stop_codon:yes gene_type:complete